MDNLDATESSLSMAVVNLRTIELQYCLRNSPYLGLFQRTIQEKISAHLHQENAKNNHSKAYSKYPDDLINIDGLFEDATGLFASQRDELKERLTEIFSKIKTACESRLQELDAICHQQSLFRPVSPAEVSLRKDVIISKYVHCRDKVLRKYQSYIANIRAIDSSTVSRKGALPSKANARLKLWFFENFLNPYPSEEEKIQLCNDTNLSVTQVNNWFINARVRIWKPTIEAIKSEQNMESADVGPGIGTNTTDVIPPFTQPRTSQKRAAKPSSRNSKVAKCQPGSGSSSENVSASIKRNATSSQFMASDRLMLSPLASAVAAAAVSAINTNPFENHVVVDAPLFSLPASDIRREEEKMTQDFYSQS